MGIQEKKEIVNYVTKHHFLAVQVLQLAKHDFYELHTDVYD